MFSKWFGGSGAQEKALRKKFSLANLKLLHEKLVSRPPPTATPADQRRNYAEVVEILRQIAELMIWGDQHDRSFFDYFADQKIISHFVQLLYKPNVDRKVMIQVVQTLSILIGNIQESGSVFYLLSNNYVNDLIVYPFDFEHEEMMAHYISFLKTLSLKLNSVTVQLLFNQEKGRFPLWEEAIKFFKHPDSMVRTAVRTLALNVFNVEYAPLRSFLAGGGGGGGLRSTPAALPFVVDVATLLRDECLSLSTSFLTQASYSSHRGRLDEICERQTDLLFFVQDLLDLEIPALRPQVRNQLLGLTLLPVLVGSLWFEHRQYWRRKLAKRLRRRSLAQPGQGSAGPAAQAAATGAAGAAEPAGSAPKKAPGARSGASVGEWVLQPHVALFQLARFFASVVDPELCGAVAVALLDPCPPRLARRLCGSGPSQYPMVCDPEIAAALLCFDEPAVAADALQQAVASATESGSAASPGEPETGGAGGGAAEPAAEPAGELPQTGRNPFVVACAADGHPHPNPAARIAAGSSARPPATPRSGAVDPTGSESVPRDCWDYCVQRPDTQVAPAVAGQDRAAEHLPDPEALNNPSREALLSRYLHPEGDERLLFSAAACLLALLSQETTLDRRVLVNTGLLPAARLEPSPGQRSSLRLIEALVEPEDDQQGQESSPAVPEEIKTIGDSLAAPAPGGTEEALSGDGAPPEPAADDSAILAALGEKRFDYSEPLVEAVLRVLQLRSKTSLVTQQALHKLLLALVWNGRPLPPIPTFLAVAAAPQDAAVAPAGAADSTADGPEHGDEAAEPMANGPRDAGANQVPADAPRKPADADDPAGKPPVEPRAAQSAVRSPLNLGFLRWSHARMLQTRLSELGSLLRPKFCGRYWDSVVDCFEDEWRLLRGSIPEADPELKPQDPAPTLHSAMLLSRFDDLPERYRGALSRPEALRKLVQAFILMRQLKYQLRLCPYPPAGDAAAGAVELALAPAPAQASEPDSTGDSQFRVDSGPVPVVHSLRPGLEVTPASLSTALAQDREMSSLFHEGEGEFQPGSEAAIADLQHLEKLSCSILVPGKHNVSSKQTLFLHPELLVLAQKHPAKPGACLIRSAANLAHVESSISRVRDSILHITIRQNERPHAGCVRFLNQAVSDRESTIWLMKVLFAGPENCLRVKRHLDRCRQTLRNRMCAAILNLVVAEAGPVTRDEILAAEQEAELASRQPDHEAEGDDGEEEGGEEEGGRGNPEPGFPAEAAAEVVAAAEPSASGALVKPSASEAAEAPSFSEAVPVESVGAAAREVGAVRLAPGETQPEQPPHKPEEPQQPKLGELGPKSAGPQPDTGGPEPEEPHLQLEPEESKSEGPQPADGPPQQKPQRLEPEQLSSEGSLTAGEAQQPEEPRPEMAHAESAPLPGEAEADEQDSLPSPPPPPPSSAARSQD